ncbi:type II and III secretion system protein family protein [Pseudodonghicola xiamenensis]|nr:type II and III secretion system protein family protein [Pseudodonghicola xiamenensis]
MKSVVTMSSARRAAMRLLGLAGLVWFGLAGASLAQTVLSVDKKRIELNVSEAKFLKLETPAKAVFLSNPGVADIDLQSTSYIYLIGKSVGETTLFVLGDDETPQLSTTISVGIDADRLTRAARGAISGGNVSVTSRDGAIFLQGRVPSPVDISSAEDVVMALTGPNAVVVNRIELAQSAQVNLQVKIAEVSRTISDDLGFSINGSGRHGSISSPTSDIVNGFAMSVTPTSVNVNFLLNALSQRGLVSILSEPNLTARSGETANFLAGGQIPYRMGTDDNDNATVQLQPYGVELQFTPVVLDGGRIEIELETKVSEIDKANSDSTDVGPALTERSASTTVEVGSGQSFAIAGMFQSGTQQALGGFPGLVDLPVIGALFRSSSFSRGETELVVIVTPYLVEPGSPGSFTTPVDGLKPVGGVEQWGMGRFTRPLKPGQDRGQSRVRTTSGGGFRLQ